MNGVTAARLKLLGLIICSTVLLTIHDVRLSAVAASAIILASLLSPAKNAMKERIAPILTICVFILLFQLAFNTAVEPAVRVLLGVTGALRILGLSLLVFLFTETTSVAEITGALAFLPESIRLMITISFALIPAIMHEAKVIRMAQQARGFRSKGVNIFASFLPLLVPLLSRTLARAEHIAVVMQARGYRE